MKDEEQLSSEARSDGKELTIKEKADIEVQKANHEIAVKQTEALATIGSALTSLSEFVTNGGLTKLLQSTSIAASANSLLNGLTAHDGRQGLDARTLKQNAIEIAELVLTVHEKFQEKLDAKAKGEERDPEVKDAEADFKKWSEPK